VTTTPASTYIGNELHTFQHAKRWKAYWSSLVLPSIRGDVLEVGAGIGANTLSLQTPVVRSWHCLEPDPALAREARAATAAIARCTVSEETTQTVQADRYDTVLYIDVLEHIEDDRGELRRAERALRRGGSVVVLSPAHQWLFSSFDEAIGHYRRYNKSTLRQCAGPGLQLQSLIYLDAVGVLLSFANRMLLRSAHPSLAQVLLWDKRVVPISRALDPRLGHRLGKSILGIWTKV
jgi:hypothetical protein